jgi:uncharacterized protein (TIGR00725 family)
MKSIRLISVIGGSQCSPAQASFAQQAGQLIAEAGLGIVCGGRGGVMEAVCRGAWQVKGFTMGILPSLDTGGANSFLTITLPTGLHEARNVLVVLAGEAVLAIGGGFGTLTEIAHAIRMGKSVVGYQTWEGRGHEEGELPIHRVESPEQAVSMLKELLEIGPQE